MDEDAVSCVRAEVAARRGVSPALLAGATCQADMELRADQAIAWRDETAPAPPPKNCGVSDLRSGSETPMSRAVGGMDHRERAAALIRLGRAGSIERDPYGPAGEVGSGTGRPTERVID